MSVTYHFPVVQQVSPIGLAARRLIYEEARAIAMKRMEQVEIQTLKTIAVPEMLPLQAEKFGFLEVVTK